MHLSRDSVTLLIRDSSSTQISSWSKIYLVKMIGNFTRNTNVAILSSFIVISIEETITLWDMPILEGMLILLAINCLIK